VRNGPTLIALSCSTYKVLAYRNRKNRPPVINGVDAVDAISLVDEAFLPVEKTLDEIEQQLKGMRLSIREAKQQAITAIEAIEVAAMAQAAGAAEAVKVAEETASRKVLEDIYAAAHEENDEETTMIQSQQLSAFNDVDYSTSEMAAPFIGEDQCLVLGEPVARVEKAPENSRRIFAGIDIPHSVDDVWSLLTDYANLQNVVPNLVVNEVLEEYKMDVISSPKIPEPDKPEEVQCRELANKMKGAKLRQIGGAKVAGIRFSARTTLEVREWPYGLPDFAHFNDEYWEGKSRKERMVQYSRTPLTRYMFPRPFALSKLPTRDISMQSIERDDGEFRMYQGVWRMQPLPGCAPPGKNAMRLTYAVEVSPRAYLPVQLIEGRIVSDLCTNLVAIRDYLASKSDQDVAKLNQATSSR
jgi:Polyketide cyclase / dehydrase and lipid transport